MQQRIWCWTKVPQMSPLWALGLVWMVCGFPIVYDSANGANAVSHNQCVHRKSHGNVKYDRHEAVSCQEKLHLGAGLSCCGQEAFNPSQATCCPSNQSSGLTERVSHGISAKVSACCGLIAYNKLNEMCCNSVIVAKPAPKAMCCGNKAFDEDTELCCGPISNKRVLKKISTHHVCCSHNQFDTLTQCCCVQLNSMEPQPLNSSCCRNKTGADYSKREIRSLRQENPDKFRSGQGDNASTVKNLHRNSCDLSMAKPWEDQCCGQTLYGLAQRGVLCCNNTLYTDREDTEVCSKNGTPYNPAKGTLCCSQFYGLPGQHCCGGEIFRPDDEICCNGHRHPKGKNVYCCGVNAYNIEDPHMKCCSGTLYNVTSLDNHGHNAQCCGSLLQNAQDVCCSSDEEQLLYSAKTGFRCCGHHYYNTSLWSCCAGMLRPVHQLGHHEGKRIKDLCQEMHIGIVESVSPHSIVFSTVLKINGRTGSVRAVSPHYILKLSDHCSSPKLTPGKTYFFNDANVFTDFNQENILHSVHLIFAKCYRP